MASLLARRGARPLGDVVARICAGMSALQACAVSVCMS